MPDRPVDASGSDNGIPEDEDVDGDGLIDTANFEATLTPIPQTYSYNFFFSDDDMTPTVRAWQM